MQKRHKILIIKTGYSEFLDKQDDSRKVSLGDVLRTTVLLHIYKNDHVTWVTDESAVPLLKDNSYIDRLLIYDLTTILQIQEEEFDIVVNLEKIPGICALADKIRAWKKYGFRFNTQNGKAEAYDKAFEALAVSSSPEIKKNNQKFAQELLFEMVGEKWKGEEYILGYNSKTQEIFDVGLNTLVGQKWPTKAWSMENWDRLEQLLKEKGFKITRQDKQDPKILANLYNYVDWINSCKIIISNDSLGLHLATVLKKKVIGLFGPTPHKEFYFYGRGQAILPQPTLECMPCFKGDCEKENFCIYTITPEMVFNQIKNLYENIDTTKKQHEISLSKNKSNLKTEVDSHKLIYHPERVSEWLKKGDCYPIYIEIGPTNRCNHRCVFCALDYLESGGADIDKNIMLSTLKEMAEKGVKSVMFAGEGEPLLHKDICDFVIKAKEYGLDVSITTNGVLFDREKIEKCLPALSWLRFSVDSGNKINYAKIHGTKEGDFDKVIENVKNAVRIRNSGELRTTIGVQFLLISLNWEEIIETAKLIKETGADNIQIKPYSHHPLSKNDFSVDYSQIGKIEEELKKLEDENFQAHFRKKTMQRLESGRNYKECYGLPFFVLIDAKGNVLPCNLFYNDPEFIYGNLYKNSFSEIWEGEKRKQALEKIRQRGLDICRMGCRLDPINRYLFNLKNPHPHDNFI